MGRDDRKYNGGTEMDVEDDTESDETSVSMKKRHSYFGTSVKKLTFDRALKKLIAIAFLIINIVIFLAGVTAIGTAIWMIVENKVTLNLLGQYFFVKMLLFAGAMISFVAIIGLFGLANRKRKFINVYIACHSLYLCLIFFCASLNFWFFEQIMKGIQLDMTTSIKNYHFGAKETWDNIHRDLKCCGIRSFHDWEKFNLAIPKSCCSRPINECSYMTEKEIYQSGCLKNAVLALKSHIHIMNMLAIFMFMTLFLSLILAFAIRKKTRRSSLNPS